MKKADYFSSLLEISDEDSFKVMDVENGWEVFLLKTAEVCFRDCLMSGHIVEKDTFDNLKNKKEWMFSIRQDNVVYATLHIDSHGLNKAVLSPRCTFDDNDTMLHILKASYVLVEALHKNGSIDSPIEITESKYDSAAKYNSYIKAEQGYMSFYKITSYLLTRSTLPEEREHEENLSSFYANESEIKKWHSNGVLHRIDGPAVVEADGSEEWWQNGKLHRVDGPAVTHANGTQKWYLNGKPHRLDGPAIIHADGQEQWFVHGTLHREDGPAIIRSNGFMSWHQDGKLHRVDGPAVIYPNGDKEEYWLNGVRLRIDELIDKA